MIFSVNHSLDGWRDHVKTNMQRVDGLKFDNIDYLENDKMTVHQFRKHPMSRTRFYLSQMKSNGRMDLIRSHVDPLGIRATAQKKISTGFLRSHRHYVDIYFINVSRLEELWKDNNPPPRMSSFEAEILGEFCDIDHEPVMKYFWNVQNEFRE